MDMRVLVIDLGDLGAQRAAAALAAETHHIDTVTDIAEAVWFCHECPPSDPAGISVAVACVPEAVRSATTTRTGVASAELGRRLRAAEVATPLLVVAARSQPEEIVAALDNGVDDYVTRPVRLSEICARVRALSRREPLVPAPQLVVGDLVLDPGAHPECRWGARRTQLTPVLTA